MTDRYDDDYDDEFDQFDDGYDDEFDQFDDGYDDQDYEVLPRVSRRGSPLAVTIVSIVAIVGIVVAATLVWATRQINPSGGPGEKVAAVDIPAGSSFADVSRILEKQDVIASATVMGWYAKFNDVKPVKAGRYVNFRHNSSMSDAIKVLDAGPVPPQETVVTIIPGSWLEDALAAIHKAFPDITVDALKLTLVSGQVTSKYHGTDPKASWEGYLLPETYQFDAKATPQQILQKIVKQFDSTLDDLGYDNAEAVAGYSAQDLVKIASMVERETGDPADERPKMARVIFNRLEKGVTTGVDATILYGLGRKGNEGGLTKTELDTPGPYNSRLTKGLPPTAISLPSKASLQAAINPAEGDWMYYVLVSRSPRKHEFTGSYAEFLKAKAECQKKGFC